MADALLDLLDEGVITPTAVQIAARADVSPRLVFHHFADLEAIYAIAAEQQYKRMAPLIKVVNPTLPLERRVSEFVRVRARFFERSSPVRRASARMEALSAEIARTLGYAHQRSRELACQAFSQELAALRGAAAGLTTDALDAISSWENWEFLRRRAGLSRRAASRVVKQMLTMLLTRAAPADVEARRK